MPIRKELVVRTTELRRGDVIKKWPNGNTNLLGARVSGKDYGDVWHTVRFEEHELPKTKRWKSTWEWTIWREEPTEIEKALEDLEIAEKKLFRAANATAEGLKHAKQGLVGLPITATEDPTHELQKYAIAWAKRKPWEDLIKLWEARNKRRADGYAPAHEDPFPDVEWGIGHAAFVYMERLRDRLNTGRFEFNQRWSDQFMNWFRNMQSEYEYKALTEPWNSLGGIAKEWHDAWLRVQKAEEEANVGLGSKQVVENP